MSLGIAATSLNGTISSMLSTQTAALSVDVSEPVEPKPHPFARLEAITARPNTLLQPPRRPHLRQSNINNDQWEVGDEISPVEEVKPMPCKSPATNNLGAMISVIRKLQNPQIYKYVSSLRLKFNVKLY